MFASLATGHPAIPTAGDIDFTPLLYMAILLLAFRRSRLPFRAWVIPVAFLAGGLVDSISDALHHSMVTTVCALTLVAILIPPPRRASARPSDV